MTYYLSTAKGSFSTELGGQWSARVGPFGFAGVFMLVESSIKLVFSSRGNTFRFCHCGGDDGVEES